MRLIDAESLSEQIFNIVTHFIMGAHLLSAVNNWPLFFFWKSGKLVKNIRVLCKFHSETNRKFIVIYHRITSLIGCADRRKICRD